MADRRGHNVLFDQPQESPDSTMHYASTSPSSMPADNLQFYSNAYSEQPSTSYMSNDYYSGSSTYPPIPPTNEIDFYAAFGTGGYPGEPPLLEELGINFSHIRDKSISVLNPLTTIDKHIMDDVDLGGPIVFILLFGVFLFLKSGELQFGYIYGVAALGWISTYALLNLMSDAGIDLLRTASVLGYCLLPMVVLSLTETFLPLGGIFGLLLCISSILWCSYSASLMFVTVLSMTDQRFLVAYPVGLFYACFALMTIFTSRDIS